MSKRIRLGKAERLLVREYHEARARHKAQIVSKNLHEPLQRQPMVGIGIDNRPQSLGFRTHSGDLGSKSARFNDPWNSKRPLKGPG